MKQPVYTDAQIKAVKLTKKEKAKALATAKKWGFKKSMVLFSARMCKLISSEQ